MISLIHIIDIFVPKHGTRIRSHCLCKQLVRAVTAIDSLSVLQCVAVVNPISYGVVGRTNDARSSFVRQSPGGANSLHSLSGVMIIAAEIFLHGQQSVESFGVLLRTSARLYSQQDN